MLLAYLRAWEPGRSKGGRWAAAARREQQRREQQLLSLQRRRARPIRHHTRVTTLKCGACILPQKNDRERRDRAHLERPHQYAGLSARARPEGSTLQAFMGRAQSISPVGALPTDRYCVRRA